MRTILGTMARIGTAERTDHDNDDADRRTATSKIGLHLRSAMGNGDGRCERLGLRFRAAAPAITVSSNSRSRWRDQRATDGEVPRAAVCLSQAGKLGAKTIVLPTYQPLG